MRFGMWEASVPVFVNSLTNMRGWLEKAAQEKSEATLLDARLAPDMRPLPAQYQMASDSAKNALARLTGTDAPSMPTPKSHSPSLEIDATEPSTISRASHPRAYRKAKIAKLSSNSRTGPAIASQAADI